MANSTSRGHWSRGGHRRSRRTKATTKAKEKPVTPQDPRIENGGSMVSRNFDCGQVRPQLQAVNSTRAMPSVPLPKNRLLNIRVPNRVLNIGVPGFRSGRRSADVDANLARRQRGVGADRQ